MATVITYRSYAKINLYLDVLDRRRDGYHNIETIFQSVSLADELQFEDGDPRVRLACSAPELDTAESNLVYRTAMLLKERTGYSGGARIRLEKRIPIAAGLAGGSGNAAAALVALNALWELRLPPRQMHALALELGSDVPFCTVGGTIAATRRGEAMTRLPPVADAWFVLLHPPIAVSASRVYNSPRLEHSHERPFAGKTASFRRAIHTLAHGELARVLFNRMESTVFATHPHLDEAKARLLEAGCSAAAMSGSGPTLFGVCANHDAARRIAESFSDYPTSVVTTVSTGIEKA
ncbi:MAG: 4-(cytidine 5'-diphospho)-2-C-methyl-D-erythritol kinase [Candidatus Hydrogenedentes bacterium]|nr:4-(cytidine 5'-diphospho)-2-C-methyl-D-erythritol kinase [Candidatus Hydrogenedentota bacterium]